MNYYVKLEEGAPPEEYYKDCKKTDARESLENYIMEHRKKHVPYHHEKDPYYY